MKNKRQMCFKQQEEFFFFFLNLYYIGFCGLVSEQSSTVFSPHKCVESVTKDAKVIN